MVDASRPPHHIETTAVLSTETDSLVPVARTAVAHARECFLRCDAVEPGVVRKTIMNSWLRSREHDVSIDHFALPFAPNPDRSDPLTHSAYPILRETDGQFSGEPVSLILTDAEGVVLDRRTGDSRLLRHLDKVSLAPGFSYAEEFAGTNGIGTALEDRGPAQVFGHEHYVEHLEELACAGAPIHHPTTGKVLGVVDLTCWRTDASAMMTAAVSSIARRIEEALLESSGRREVTLLQDYLSACRRNRGPVLAVSNDLVMLNDAAREQIDPRDQVTLLGLITEALAGGKPAQFTCSLPSGVSVRAHCKPSFRAGSMVGGVSQVSVVARATAAPSELPAPPPVSLPGLVGTGALWLNCCQEVEAHFRSREPVLLEGEPGTGKLAVARATHLAHAPGAHLRVFDAADVAAGTTEPARWVSGVREELISARGTIILRHVDQLPDVVLDELAGLLGLVTAAHTGMGADRDDRLWVVATRTGTGPVRGSLGRLVTRFPGTVVVPPLRHHVEDVAELVPFLILRLTRGAGLRCAPEAMRVLMRNRWPGNVEQLYQVIRKVVAHRRTGLITQIDLPAEVQTHSRRVLTPLESIECDAIIAALRGSDGNRAEAARHLGMSRATIYRKIRDFGIDVPASK
ncbi:MAG TPA: helix-turn-helix domain-containing protein [Pseudonocardia sp.]|nr:helix-turn-helix domain-containing protein [Pseudonocardia sp.]